MDEAGSESAAYRDEWSVSRAIAHWKHAVEFAAANRDRSLASFALEASLESLATAHARIEHPPARERLREALLARPVDLPSYYDLLATWIEERDPRRALEALETVERRFGEMPSVALS